MHTDILGLNHQVETTQETAHKARLPRHFFAGLMIFTAAYFVTISVNAQTNAAPADVIQMNAMGPTVVTGTIIESDDRYVVIDSAGTPMHINLEEIEMKGDADVVFKVGMDVEVQGKMTGTSSSRPVIEASSITARELPAAR